MRQKLRRIDPSSFFWGIGIGLSLASLVAGLVVALLVPMTNGTDGLDATSSENPSVPTQLKVVANRTTIGINEKVTLTVVSVGKRMQYPVTFVWSADSGSGLPHGATQLTEATWLAPGYPTRVEIKVIAIDALGYSVTGRALIPVTKSNQP